MRTHFLRRVIVMAALAQFGATSYARAAATEPTPVTLTADEDHSRLMKLLGIETLRRGADGNPKSPTAANADESKVPPYKLPDPLTFNDGRPVKSPADWSKRRAELFELFD